MKMPANKPVNILAAVGVLNRGAIQANHSNIKASEAIE